MSVFHSLSVLKRTLYTSGRTPDEIVEPAAGERKVPADTETAQAARKDMRRLNIFECVDQRRETQELDTKCWDSSTLYTC